MSDENDIAEEDATRDETKGPVCGERLAEARRRQQISVYEIAKELHLDDFKVRALENNEFEVIGAPVFAKGHLRKYAQLVKVDEADVLADYYQLERTSGAPLVLLRDSRPRRRRLRDLPEATERRGGSWPAETFRRASFFALPGREPCHVSPANE